MQKLFQKLSFLSIYNSPFKKPHLKFSFSFSKGNLFNFKVQGGCNAEDYLYETPYIVLTLLHLQFKISWKFDSEQSLWLEHICWKCNAIYRTTKGKNIVDRLKNTCENKIDFPDIFFRLIQDKYSNLFLDSLDVYQCINTEEGFIRGWSNGMSVGSKYPGYQLDANIICIYTGKNGFYFAESEKFLCSRKNL